MHLGKLTSVFRWRLVISLPLMLVLGAHSGGERQRLALARALLIRPKLPVLDETTSNLDADNERRIRRALAALRGQMTIVIIAHQPSSIRSADQIVVVEDGAPPHSDQILGRGNGEMVTVDRFPPQLLELELDFNRS